MSLRRTALAKISRRKLDELGFMPSSTFTKPRTSPLPSETSGVDGSAALPNSSTKKVHSRALGKGLRTTHSTFTNRPKLTGPSREVVEMVLERDHYSCASCGGELYGDRGTGWSIGHRRPRRSARLGHHRMPRGDRAGTQPGGAYRLSADRHGQAARAQDPTRHLRLVLAGRQRPYPSQPLNRARAPGGGSARDPQTKTYT
jgi:hypothetical protein